MLQQFIPQGPDAEPLEILDRTRAFDETELWPAPLACPNWPLLYGDRRYDGDRGRLSAEARLTALGHALNRGTSKVRAPTMDERADIIGRWFRDGPTNIPDWLELGLKGLRPAGVLAEQECVLMVEAVHVRGYLRKLDAEEEHTKDIAAARKRREAQQRLDGYKTAVATGIAELAELAEAEARHKQRIADEQAAGRAHTLRQTLRHGHYDASQAATFLGVKAPDLPNLEN